jgi:AmiR/NasT family two-component response regulator
MAEDMPVGALNIYSRNEMAFVPDAQELASVFAVEASLILTRAGLAVTDDQLAQRLGESLRIRRVIAQAEGVIMEREGIGADEAYAVLCDYSRLSNRPFRDHARDVTASTFRPGSERGEDHDG